MQVLTVLLLTLILGDAIDYADFGRSDFSCGDNGQVLYSNLTVCQLQELMLCPSDYYPQFDAYLRPLTCPLPLCYPDGEWTSFSSFCLEDVTKIVLFGVFFQSLRIFTKNLSL